jgi:hypothetical protein
MQTTKHKYMHEISLYTMSPGYHRTTTKQMDSEHYSTQFTFLNTVFGFIRTVTKDNFHEKEEINGLATITWTNISCKYLERWHLGAHISK